ncbi:hypothetical protein MUN76_03400 [Leucobacter rhizosphaerae]|uniref:Uncharacterized protein n=1 Tax=Leucobacter rhizosphaerae TaxID=2932245 RepID=A0ABY4FXL0_9MICO|nr:hypothetical protein [Leucobacter rhizosphaerae]UOQ61035.1 hypothetical protein MUN76_03400 [Leucobacter rhizosphaerae]
MKSAEVCVLAATGGVDAVPLALTAAVVLVVLGIIAVAAARSSRGRRGLAAGFGALALVGALVVVPLASATPVQAATGANTSECDPAQQPPAEKPPVDPPVETPDSVIVSPAAPALSDVACGVEPAVLIPEMDGVAYGQTRAGNIVTVTATAEPGFVLAEGAVATWPLDVTPQPCACVPDEINWGADPIFASVDDYAGYVYVQPQEWTEALVAQGSSFSVVTQEVTQFSGQWVAQNGELPEGIDPGTVTFDGVIDKSGTNGALTEWGALQFDLATSGQSAYSTYLAEEAALRELYPESEITFQIDGETWLYQFTSSLTVTLLDSCGTAVSRSYDLVRVVPT